MAVRRLVPRMVGLAVVLYLTVGCGAQPSSQGSPKDTGTTTVKYRFPRRWHVGNFTVSTYLLPKFYDPNASFNFMDLEPSALYYVSESTPTELVARSLFNGRTHVVARIDCATTWRGLPTEVYRATSYPYVLVQCGSPPGGMMLQGILVDVTTGATWTLWTGGGETEDLTPDGRAVVSAGWVYFVEGGPPGAQGAMDLATGDTKPLPFPLNSSGWNTFVAPDGTLYDEWFKKQDLTSIDLYRVTGLTATLVAHLPGGGAGTLLSIDANGTIWVNRPGGSLTPNAGAMSIRVWHPTYPPVPPKSKILFSGTGYVVSLGAAGTVQVTLATSGGVKTISVGNAFDASDTYFVQYGPGPIPGGLIFPAPQGRWQILTVSGG